VVQSYIIVKEALGVLDPITTIKGHKLETWIVSYNMTSHVLTRLVNYFNFYINK
jgi:hypothetical protein